MQSFFISRWLLTRHSFHTYKPFFDCLCRCYHKQSFSGYKKFCIEPSFGTRKCLSTSMAKKVLLPWSLNKQIRFNHDKSDTNKKQGSTKKLPKFIRHKPPEEPFPILMDIGPYYNPRLLKVIKNRIQTALIIQPVFDKDFTPEGFLEGAKQALVTISNLLADGKLNEIRERTLMTEEAVETLRPVYEYLSPKQREFLRINPCDIGATFIREIGIIMNDDETRFVEITVIFHCLREIWKQDFKDFSLVDYLQKYQEPKILCNYRFIREYTKGVNDDWRVNLLNHYKGLMKASNPPL